jgi:malonate transporter
MSPVISLAMPFFGLILLGFACGRFMKLPEAGLAWMNFFIVYVSLPPLFFKLVSATPFEQLTNWRFIALTTFCTFCIYVAGLGAGLYANKGNLREGAIAAIIGAYANVGYMGPGLTLAALGPESSVPTALIFVFDSMFFFSIVPLLMALGGNETIKVGPLVWLVFKRIVTHPFNVATFCGVVAAWFKWQPPLAIDTILNLLKGAAAPVALFTLGVTVALRPLTRVPAELPVLLIIKLLIAPLLVFGVLEMIGGFDPIWVKTAVLMAALPPALGAYVMARQYECYVQRASSGVLVGTLVSIVTVTGLLWLVAENKLPGL